MKQLIYLLAICLFSISNITCILAAKIPISYEIYEEGDISYEYAEEDTLSFYAMSVQTTQDAKGIAIEAVDACVKAYGSNYNQAASNAKAQYGQSSATKLAIIEIAKSFADQIISQIDSLAQKLTAQQKQQFWSAAEIRIKTSLGAFVANHGVKSTSNLDEHIKNQIGLKKLFG